MFYSLTKHGGQQFQKCYALFQKNPSYTHVLQNWFNAQYFVPQKDIFKTEMNNNLHQVFHL